MTPRRDWASQPKPDDHRRKNRNPAGCKECRATRRRRSAGKAQGTGAISQSAGTYDDSLTCSRLSGRKVAEPAGWTGSGHDPGGSRSGDDHLAHGTQLIRERIGDHQRPGRSGALLDCDIPSLGSTTDPAASSPISRAPANEASRKPPILSIRETMAAAARALRDKPCPTGHCPRCYAGACRLLLADCCICTGHINPKDKTKFLQ